MKALAARVRRWGLLACSFAALMASPWAMADERGVAVDRTILAQAPKPPATGAPSSRDELFGLKPPAGTPAAEEKKAFSLTGFYDFVGAYTYSDPSHWSQAVNRLQLSAQGDLGAGVKWKIGGRFDIDPVYYWSSFYLPDVERDQRTNAFWRETYLDFSAGSLDFRVGAQNIVWGEVVGIFVADVVTAKDQREFLLPSFDIIRKPQWAARAEYFKGDSHVELVWIPFQTFDDIGKPGADFYPVPLPSPTSQTVASTFLNPVTPAKTLSNSAYGIRANTLLGGWDLAAFYYRSYDVNPTFYRLPGPSAAQPFVFQPQHDRIWQVGGTASKDFGPFVGRAELVYTDGRNFASTDPTAPQGVLARDTYDWVVSADFTLPHEVRLNVQAFQRIYSSSDSSLALQTGDFGGSILLAGKITPTVEPQILWIQTFGGGGGLVRPRINWNAFKNTTLALGVDIFTGPDDGFFGRYNNRDRVYTEVRLDF
jgi:hypothetical protein